jgi:hypothetical protein
MDMAKDEPNVRHFSTFEDFRQSITDGSFDPSQRYTVPAATDAPPAHTFRTASSPERKEYPIFSGLLAYFPDALADVARISFKGNQKHNPGEALHWAREKSNDHLDCAVRHTIQAQWDDESEDHLGEAIWRLLAEKQLRLEAKYNLSAPKNAVDHSLEQEEPFRPGQIIRATIKT